VFQYLALAALCAYLTQYRHYKERTAGADAPLVEVPGTLPGKRLA
jgi:hypothetical protein